MRDELILVGMYITTFGLGYVLGLLRHNSTTPDTRPPSFLKTTAKDKQAVTHVGIDDRKYVAPIDTAGLTSGHSTNSIGKTTSTKDDIQGSVSKLAQLKGK